MHQKYVVSHRFLIMIAVDWHQDRLWTPSRSIRRKRWNGCSERRVLQLNLNTVVSLSSHFVGLSVYSHPCFEHTISSARDLWKKKTFVV